MEKSNMKNKYLYLSILFLVITIIGVVSVLNNSISDNIGSLFFPSILSLFFFLKWRELPKEKSFYFSILFLFITVISSIALVNNNKNMDLNVILFIAALSLFLFLKSTNVKMKREK